MNKNIDKFDNFLLEKSDDKKAISKLKRAEDKVEDAKKYYSKGSDDRADKKLKKAKEYLEEIKVLDPDLDTSEIESDIEELESVNWKEEFDIKSSSFFGKRIKSDDFDYLDKIKIIGNEISPDEAILFFKTVRTYINLKWDDIKDDSGKSEYLSTHHEKMVLDINNRRREVKFSYREGRISDVIKLYIDKDKFDNDENKERIVAELDKLIGTKHLVDKEEGKISKKYNVKKDDIILVPTIEDEIVKKAEKIAENPVIQQTVKELVVPNSSFIRDSINLLVSEKLNVGMVNTDEQAIFDWFVTNNDKKTINGKNIDAILTGYKRKKATANEAWYNDWDDFTDATVGGIKRGWKSVAGTESKGVVQDLMNAYNTDAKTVSKDMNDMLRKMGDAYGNLITREVEKASVKIKQSSNNSEPVGESFMFNENAVAGSPITINNVMNGVMVASAIPAVKNKKIPSSVKSSASKVADASKKVKLSPTERFAKGQSPFKNGFISKSEKAFLNTRKGKKALKVAERQFLKKASKKVAVQGAKRGIGGLLLRGGGGIASLLGIGSIPVVGWVIIGVVAVSALSYYLYNTFSEQQHQIAHIFLLMWASQSPTFLQEMKRAGIRLNENLKLNIDEEKLGQMLGQSIEEEPVAEEVPETEYQEVETPKGVEEDLKERVSIKKFESFISVKNEDTVKEVNMFNMSVSDKENNIVFNENVEYDAIKELKKDFKEKGYKIAVKKAKKDDE
jgi:hypothetical protein